MLASRSPQRRAILERLGVAFEVRPADVAELDAGDPARVALENARLKARAAAARAPAGTYESGAGTVETVLGCDTLVALDGLIYGKPADAGAARATLRALSGVTHAVHSGLALVRGEQELVATARTEVTFRALDEPLLEWYLSREEWRGRAGAYAIQGAGAALVRTVEGDYENVVGLPLAALLDLLPALVGGVRERA